MNRLWIMNTSLTIQFVMMLIYGSLVGAALGANDLSDFWNWFYEPIRWFVSVEMILLAVFFACAVTNNHAISNRWLGPYEDAYEDLWLDIDRASAWFCILSVLFLHFYR